MWLPRRISLGNLRDPMQFLGEILEEIAIRGQLIDLESQTLQLVRPEVATESGGVEIGCEVRRAPEWCGGQQDTARPQQPHELAERRDRVGNMLEHFRAEHRIARAVRLRNPPDVGYDVQPLDIPGPHLQAR